MIHFREGVHPCRGVQLWSVAGRPHVPVLNSIRSGRINHFTRQDYRMHHHNALDSGIITTGARTVASRPSG